MKRIIIGFIAGALATLVVFNIAFFVAQNFLLWVPADRPPPWAWGPAVHPIGFPAVDIPNIVNKMFWGGVWGSVLGLLLGGVRGIAGMILWIVLGAVLLTAVGTFLVPLIKGGNIDTSNLTLMRFRTGLLLNGAWGLGTGVLMQMFGRPGR